jgi:hypothetical protein
MILERVRGKKMNKLFEAYLIEVNRLDEIPKKKRDRLKFHIKNLDWIVIQVIGACIGIMTLKVMAEQLAMQIGAHLR